MKTLILILLLSFNASSQLTISAGTSFYLGDLGGTKGIGRNGLKDLNTRAMGYSFGVTKTLPNDLQLNFSYTSLHDADSNIKRIDSDNIYRYQRGFYFKTGVIELSLLKPFSWNILSVKTGLSLLYLTRTTNAEKNYPAIHGALPFIIQLEKRNKGIRFTYYKLFTDYIDGYSLRADPRDNDSFFTLSLTYSMVKSKKGFWNCPRL